MRMPLIIRVLLAGLILSGAVAGENLERAASSSETKLWTDHFDLSACSWSSNGRSGFFILEPGYQEILDGHEGKEAVHLEITVLNETRKVGGVETRIIEERESHDGQLEEISRNLFALCGPGNDVFYFGEDVDIYKGGKVAGHEGAWTADTAGAKAGLFMPSRPLLGARYYQEVAPGVAMDRVEIVSDNETLKTPAGTFQGCPKTEETTPLEPGAKEYKVFARGIGIVQDGELVLTKYGFITKKNQ